MTRSGKRGGDSLDKNKRSEIRRCVPAGRYWDCSAVLDGGSSDLSTGPSRLLGGASLNSRPHDSGNEGVKP